MIGIQAESKVTIRAARADDLPGVEQLLSSSGLPTVGVSDAFDSFLVAEHEGALVGVVGLEGCGSEYALLRSAAIAPAWQGRGIGGQLVERVIGAAESRGIKALYLLTTTAARYFPSFGFHEITREVVPASVQATAEFRGACPASATVMAKTLGQSRGRT